MEEQSVFLTQEHLSDFSRVPQALGLLATKAHKFFSRNHWFCPLPSSSGLSLGCLSLLRAFLTCIPASCTSNHGSFLLIFNHSLQPFDVGQLPPGPSAKFFSIYILTPSSSGFSSHPSCMTIFPLERIAHKYNALLQTSLKVLSPLPMILIWDWAQTHPLLRGWYLVLVGVSCLTPGAQCFLLLLFKYHLVFLYVGVVLSFSVPKAQQQGICKHLLCKVAVARLYFKSRRPFTLLSRF